ncbi:efflux RND transporter periplasmic adaptor subunit [Pelobium sp.]|nr:efflux RND transporter periplasmic adaptor subunit [Pelobium sp.]MDA9554927.1 efflux RND transporter periplasmic adaptor subunit [Pelobium sp.]
MSALRYIIVLLFMGSMLACTNDKKTATTAHENDTYTCPMHPQIVENKMGSCPICGMDLVKVNHQNEKSKGLTLMDNQIKLANIKTIKVGSSGFADQKLLNARLVNNPLNSQVISSKFSGRIDQLYFKETGVNIAKGQALYRIYSEELLTLQKDYIVNLKQQKAFPNEKIYQSLLLAAKNKLTLYGYSNQQINALAQANQTNPYITVYAPSNGIITEINITEGQYVNEGSPIFKLDNFDSLWVEADIYPSEIGEAKVGQIIQVLVAGYENQPIQTKVEFVSPQLNESSQILTIRASIKNPNHQFVAGMQANIGFTYFSRNNGLTLPNEAVLRDQNGNHVWIKTGKNNFEYRLVEIESENENSVLIKSGIQKGDEVVVTGAYLLSSEYILKKGGDFMAGMNM